MKNRSILALALACIVLVVGCTHSHTNSSPTSSSRSSSQAQADIQKSDFGTTDDGQRVERYTLTNSHGSSIKIITYGATLTEVWVADRSGKPGDVVLGFDNLKLYQTQSPYFGATVGRYSNRIANGAFSLDGKQYKLFVNNGLNSLHGGKKGFDKRVWKAEPSTTDAGPSVKFTLMSPDGDEGYPGNLKVSVTYTLTHQNEIKIEYSAATDQTTPLNLTNHSYWNLGAMKSATILDEVLMINADHYTPFDPVQIPTGKIEAVDGTALDFRRPTPIGARIKETPGGPGYDHNYVLNKKDGELSLAARADDPRSGRVMEVYTTEPGLQFYTGNHLDGTIRGVGGVSYPRYSAFCLETEHFPDSPNHRNFPSTLLKPGERYHQLTVYRFSVE